MAHSEKLICFPSPFLLPAKTNPLLPAKENLTKGMNTQMRLAPPRLTTSCSWVGFSCLTCSKYLVSLTVYFFPHAQMSVQFIKPFTQDTEWALCGQCTAKLPRPLQNSGRILVLPAVSLDGLVAVMAQPGSILRQSIFGS
ncbi:hypothetical protein VP01_3506g1 [Puccinia sorghi]|uniref:Uncharacterized protein n=1 Tax=Puccinia sorghi TaxID=27349 RepID=A0A0L6UVP6_9BASI|nr:hypothetical protein VP01_3506g1 [Puccinia sorghi]